MSRRQTTNNTAESSELQNPTTQRQSYCPFCGESNSITLSETIQCTECSTTFSVSLESEDLEYDRMLLGGE